MRPIFDLLKKDLVTVVHSIEIADGYNWIL